jgi:hypothetical protein
LCFNPPGAARGAGGRAAPPVRHHAAVCLDMPTEPARERRAPLAALDALLAFRAAVYAAFGRRADALFELLDALASAGAVASPIHLSLEPAHRRGWGSFYAALNEGAVPADAVEAVLVRYPLAEAAAGPLLYGVDTSVWPRCDAETSPERGFYHHSARHSAGQPIVAGWAFQWVAQLSLTRDSWTAPLSVRRVPPGTNVNAAAAAQVRDLVARRPADGQVPLFAFDCGYDPAQLAEHLLGKAGVAVAIVVRLREGRCFYAEPPPAPAAAAGRRRAGRPRRHGAKFACAAPATWWAPTAEHTDADPQYGRARVRAWGAVHAQVQTHPTRGTRSPRPIQRGTLILVEVERLPRQTRHPKPMWLWWQGPEGATPDLALIWRAYVHRFDLEHTLRFAKQSLDWTTLRVRQPAAAERWPWLVVLAYTQLRLARPVVADLRLPWERPLPEGHLTPNRVRRGFSQLRELFGTPAAPPKPCGHPAGRPKGRRSGRAARVPAVKLTAEPRTRPKTRRRKAT